MSDSLFSSKIWNVVDLEHCERFNNCRAVQGCFSWSCG